MDSPENGHWRHPRGTPKEAASICGQILFSRDFYRIPILFFKI
jgi:hypothetical protein